MKNHTINLTVNGKMHELNVPANQTLLQTLRDELGMTEAKYGCGMGECGSCTILDEEKKSIVSCLTLTCLMDGKKITTVAGLEEEGRLHPVQEAFIDKHAVQCGFCTPGMIMKSVGILEKNPEPTEKEIRKALEGNICRCTGYEKIVDAVKCAGEKIKQGSCKKSGGKS